ncbi:4557_t:CDS:2, partial [Dentiscutata erythropus]
LAAASSALVRVTNIRYCGTEHRTLDNILGNLERDNGSTYNSVAAIQENEELGFFEEDLHERGMFKS